MADQDLDRSEEATPHKLQKAREQAQTPRSPDATAATVFAVAILVLTWHGAGMAQALMRLFQSALLQVGAVSVDDANFWPLVTRLAVQTAAIWLPLLIALPAAAVLASIAQTGMVFSPQPLRADFGRLNPANGFRRVFSLRTLFEGVRACCKLLLLVTTGAAALYALLPQFQVLSALPPAAFLQVALADVASLCWKMALALALIAAVDLVFTRREFSRRMRMSRRELKDEYKNRERDPRIRSRLRELRRELLRRSRALRNTRNADVVLANPTHYAVALRYVHGEMPAPQVVAKGAGHLAAGMREIAARHGIVVVHNPLLTRRLFRAAAIDAYLAPEFHAEVARIFVWLIALRQQHAKAGAPA